MLREVLKHIEQRERFLLTSHARPDGDAVGSALACCQILHSMGKEADVVLRDGVPRVYRPLPFADRVVQSDRVNGEYEAAIILECDSIQRTRLEGLEERFLINIDHHLSGRPFAHVNWIDPQAVAREEDCEGLVNYALAIQDVEVAAFFRELPDGHFRLSLRSKGQWNVAAVAEHFGGGGHQCASGCSIDGPLPTATARVLAELRITPSVQ